MKRISLLLIAALAVIASPCFAQVYSNQSTVTLNMNISESVTIVPSSVSLPPFSYTNGAANSGTQQFTLTTAWQLAPGHTHYDIAAWVSSAAAAMANGTGGQVPSSEVYLQANAGLWGACNRAPDPFVPAAINGQSCPVSGSNFPAAAASAANGTTTDTFTVGLVGLPAAGLPPGAYVGVMTFEVGVN